MNKQDLQAKLKDFDIVSQYSTTAISIVEDMLEESQNIDELYELSWEEIDREFIYYSTAFNYLMDNNITDFEDAFKEFGATNVCGIAYYYCLNEINQIISYLEEQYDD